MQADVTEPLLRPALQRRSLARRAAVVGALLLATVLAVLAGTIYHDLDDRLYVEHERVGLEAARHALELAHHLDAVAQFEAHLAALVNAGVDPRHPMVAGAVARARQTLPQLQEVAFFDAKGRTLAMLGARAFAAPALRFTEWPSADRPCIARAPVSFLSAGAASRPAHDVLAMLRSVDRPSGERVLIVALVDTATLLERTVPGEEPGLLALAHADGPAIATRPAQREPARTPARWVDIAGAAPLREWVGHGLRPMEQIGAARTVRGYPLVALVEVAREEVIARWWTQTRTGFAGVALGAVALYVAVMALLLRGLRASDAAHRRLDVAAATVLQRATELTMTIKSLQELVFRTDVHGVIVYLNHDWAVMSGADLAHAEGRLLGDLVVGCDRGRVRALFDPDGPGGARSTQATLANAGAEGPRIFSITVLPVLHDGRLCGFTGSAVDVTERVAAAERVKAQLAFTELLMETSPLPTAVLDLSGCYMRVNKAWERFHGCQRERLIGRLLGSFNLSEGSQAEHHLQDERLIQGGDVPVRYEARVVHSDGTLRDVVFEKALIPASSGASSGVLVVMVDVTEFRRAELATREARDAAEEASRAKSEFIANISHELRTPLQSIIGFSEIGALRAPPGERSATLFRDVRDAGTRMLALVNDLLDVAKLESAIGTMHLESTDLRGLVREAARELEPLLAARRLGVEFELPGKPLVARIDPPRFKQVLRNVLANAIKFSPEQSRITVVGDWLADDGSALRISDRGPGIPPAELESIFEAFVQSSSTKDGSGGTGLGLTICRKIVQAHGGRIYASGRAGGGSTFHIELPPRGARSTDFTPAT